MATTSSRKPSSERRDEIARAALTIIGTRGIGSLTTASLAAEVGLSSGALFRHFANREEILEEAVCVAEAAIDDSTPDASLPPMERLRTMALNRIALLNREPGIAWLLRSEQAKLALPPAAVTRLRRTVKRSQAFMRSALDEAVSANLMRSDISTDVLQLTFSATVHALIGPPRLQGRPKTAAAPSRALDGLLALFAPQIQQRKRR